ncbi:hypothetical protein JCM35486_20610 [Blautia wexlerae]
MTTKGAVTSKEHAYRNYPARAGEDSKGKSEAIMTPPKGAGPLLKQRLRLSFSVGLSGMITIGCICTDKPKCEYLDFSIIAGAIL